MGKMYRIYQSRYKYGSEAEAIGVFAKSKFKMSVSHARVLNIAQEHGLEQYNPINWKVRPNWKAWKRQFRKSLKKVRIEQEIRWIGANLWQGRSI